MTTASLRGRTALVTGSAQGIGLAIALRLARDGARIVLHDLAKAEAARDAVAAVLAAGAADATFLGHDLRDVGAITALMDEALAWHEGLDVVVNNAGIQFTASIVDMPVERWDAILAVNLSSAFHTMRRALPGMIERGFGRIVNIASVHGIVASAQKAPYVAAKFGRIVNIASVHGIVASAQKAPYVAAKFGLVGLTRVAALECAAAGSRDTGGVTANCIAPGWTETTLIQPQIQARADQFGGDRGAGIRELLREKQPSQRMSMPSEIAEVAAMLCQPWAHNINGITLPVDGGWTAQ